MATDRWCFAWAPGRRDAGGRLRPLAVIETETVWARGETISVAFLDGDGDQQDRVRSIAQDWTRPGRAGLSFDFEPSGRADIRISFQRTGSWSMVGTSCRSVEDEAEPTMNFGWLRRETPRVEAERVVRHEFGHALGLVHEHQNPEAGIQWDREAVIRAYADQFSVEQIVANILTPAAMGAHNYSAFDPGSIMLYPIAPGMTLDGYSVGLNHELSTTDIAFVNDQYP